jgi:hypothetical protein
MTLEELAHHYYDMWVNGSFSKAGPDFDIMARGDDVADFFIEDARGKGLATEDDIQAEAGTLAEAIDEKANKLSNIW